MCLLPAHDRIGIVVACDSSSARQRAVLLSRELGLPLDCADRPLQLAVTETRLELRETGERTGPVYVDFVGGAMGKRRQGGWSRDPLVRAIGRKGDSWRVLDATAGLGRDAFVLALAGCHVTAVERSPVMAALLEDGLRRADLDVQLRPVVQRLHLVKGDSRDVLDGLTEADRPDAAYIDPMFAHRAKSALSKKEMQFCRLVSGDDTDAADLLAVARRVARHRVVVKRWLHAPPLGPHPAIQYKGRSIRYDVYPSPTL